MRRSLLLAAFLPIWLAIAHPAAAEDGITKSWAIAEFGEPLYRDNFKHWPYVNPNAPKGGSIVLGAFGTFDSLNPYILKGDYPRSIGLTSDSLMTPSGDELSSVYGLIAESIELPADRSWAVFELRPEARYHDGVAITAQDFVFALEMIRKHGRPFLKSFFNDVEAAEALSERRLKFTFKSRDSMKPVMIVAGMSPIPRHYWKDREFNATTLEPPLASGPYRIADVEPGRRISYERVKDYWAAELPVNIGLNNFDTIRYEYFRDFIVTFEAFKAGKLDYHQDYFSKNWATGYDFAAVEDGRIIRRAVPDERPKGLQAFLFNMRRPPFDDIRVREAISELYDFETTKRLLLYNFYTRSKSNFPNSDFGASGAPTAEEKAILQPYADRLRPEILSQAFEPSQTDGSGRIRDNLRRAWRLLKQAGWEIRDKKLVNAETGRQMRLELLIVQPNIERLAQPFIKNLRRAGIDAKLRLIDTAQYEIRTDEFDFEMITVNWNFFPPPGPELRSYFGSEAADIRGSANVAGIKHPVVDELIEKIIAAQDLERLKALTRALDRVLLWQFSSIPQYYNGEDWLAYWNIFGHPARKPRFAVGFPETWWIDADKFARLRPRGRSE